jgi:hypothetical protein
MRTFILAITSTAVLLSGCMTLDQDREVQRPELPRNNALAWTSENRLYRSVVLDYVTGMSQHSYLFGKANQSSFRPLLDHALEATDLGAPANAPAAGRYALQIEFKELEGSAVGTDFKSRSVAVYRIVDRSSNATVYQQEVSAAFDSKFPGLNEDDAATAAELSGNSLALTLSATAGYAIGEHFRSDINGWGVTYPNYWKNFYYANAAAALFGPAVVTANFVLPTNYIALPNFNGDAPSDSVPGARRGELSEEGMGARSGFDRARQADFMMMRQSLTKFVIGLGDAEHVQITTIMPCLDNDEVRRIETDLTIHGRRWRTDDCTPYMGRVDPTGRTFTSYH